ncbi:hypothetical protein [Spiroplasma endosymbiont of Colias croceus]|uniref:hypothetical protein n=1 Tax=Spiroplasma endosymbiont of Colias croceus TaxID=3066310 RepID=UPI0030D094AF
MTDKTKSQTYNFLSENKSIEDIKKQANIEVKEKSRHGGKTFKIIEKPILSLAIHNSNNDPNSADENLEPIAISLTDNEKIQETNNYIWTKIKNYLNLPTANTEEISKLHTTIQEQAKEIQKLIKENEKLKLKQSNDNLAKFSYNAITIYDEKQRKKTGIEKMYEEILPINNELYFITTFQNINNSLTEEIICFQELINSDIQVVQQIKNYKNISEYKKDIVLMEDTSKYNNCQFLPIKDFLKKQQDFKLKPTKKEIGIWIISWLIIPLGVVAINLIHPPLLIMSLVIGGIAIVLRGGAELFSPKSKKVWSWISNKICKNEELKEKNKKERQSIIKNLTSDKLETKLQTQYDILKQKIDNRKEEIPNQLINSNSNSILKNSNIENNQNFDSSIRNTINNQNQQPSTISRNNWNKLKCLLTT